MRIFTASIFIILIISFGCKNNSSQQAVVQNIHENPFILETETVSEAEEIEKDFKAIHILVALCDNKYQGIVPVPAGIGNGQDARNNLYWGTAYGIKTYFKRSEEWNLVKTEKVDKVIPERAIFKHATKAV